MNKVTFGGYSRKPPDKKYECKNPNFCDFPRTEGLRYFTKVNDEQVENLKTEFEKSPSTRVIKTGIHMY